MAKYLITLPDGRKFQAEGDHSPTQEDLDFIYKQYGSTPPPPVEEKKPGFFQSVAQGIAKPFLKTGLTLARGAEGVYALGKFGVQAATGNKEGAKATIANANAKITQPKDFGYLGKTNVGGYDDQGKPLSTAEQVKDALGTGLELGSYAIGGGEVPGVLGAAKQGVFQAAKRGAIAGAEVGGVAGLGTGLQDVADSKASAGEQALEVAGSTLKGAGAGAIFGAAGGAVGGRVLGKPAREAERIVELTRPLQDTAEREAGLAAGRGQSGTFFKKPTIAPSARDIERAAVAQEAIGKIKDPNKAIQAINSDIGKKSGELVDLLKGNNAIFNKAQFKTYVTRLKDSPDRQIILAGDDAANRAYDGVLDTFMSILDKHDKNLTGLLEARKEFDQVAERGMKGVFNSDATQTARKQAILDIRREANNYIADQLPSADPMRELLHKQNLLFEARDNIVAKEARAGTPQSGLSKTRKRIYGGLAAGAGTYGLYALGKAALANTADQFTVK